MDSLNDSLGATVSDGRCRARMVARSTTGSRSACSTLPLLHRPPQPTNNSYNSGSWSFLNALDMLGSALILVFATAAAARAFNSASVGCCRVVVWGSRELCRCSSVEEDWRSVDDGREGGSGDLPAETVGEADCTIIGSVSVPGTMLN